MASGLGVIPGEEITTDQGDVIGLFMQEQVPPGPLPRVLDVLRSQDAIVYIPHPFDPLRRRECIRGVSLKDIADVIEVFNGRCLSQRFNERAEEYARQHGLPMGAGSDAHSLWEVGHGYLSMEEFHDRTEFLQALRGAAVVRRPSSPLVHAYTKALKVAARIGGAGQGRMNSPLEP